MLTCVLNQNVSLDIWYNDFFNPFIKVYNNMYLSKNVENLQKYINSAFNVVLLWNSGIKSYCFLGSMGCSSPYYKSDIIKLTLLCYLYSFQLGCNNASFYDSNSNTHCPINCKDSTCHIQNGAGFTCKPKWTGIHCDTSKMTNISHTKFKLSSYLSFLKFEFKHLLKHH